MAQPGEWFAMQLRFYTNEANGAAGGAGRTGVAAAAGSTEAPAMGHDGSSELVVVRCQTTVLGGLSYRDFLLALLIDAELEKLG